MFNFKTIAAAAVIAVVGTAAAAVPLGPASFSLGGTFEAPLLKADLSSNVPLATGGEISILSVNSSVESKEGNFVGIDDGSVVFSGSGTVTIGNFVQQVGELFSATFGGAAGTFSFGDVLQTSAMASETGSLLGFLINGKLTVDDTSGFYDTPVLADFSFSGTAATQSREGTFSLSVSVPEIPVPAALPLLVSGLAALGVASRRKRKAA